MSKQQSIHIDVEVDENNIPEKIQWLTDNGKDSEAKALILSVWDGQQNSALRIDLWTKDMQVDEMKMMFHQTIVTMADSFERATGEKEMSLSMKDFAEYFAEKMGLISS